MSTHKRSVGTKEHIDDEQDLQHRVQNLEGSLQSDGCAESDVEWHFDEEVQGDEL